MKKASYILLAMMLIIAVFVSCKAEVIDDSDYLVNVMFSSENNSKGLTWSRDFAPENYYWSYDASKADNGPRTGTATKAKVGGENGQGLKHDVGPFSIGTWDFTLYGYRDPGRNELVYEGAVQTPLAKDNNSSVKVHVSSKDEKAGTIRVSKDIRLTDGTNTTYAPTHFSIKNAKDSSFAVDTDGKELKDLEFSTTGDMSCTVKSGSYVVTIEMRNEDGLVVYSSTQIYINVYDYQTTRIGGSLDDVKVSTKFEADDGTITGTSGVQAIRATGSTTLTVKNVTPINSGDTTVEFPQGSLGSNVKKATLEVVAYPTSYAKGFGINDENGVPVVGIDLSVFVDGNEVTEFGSAVTVTTFVTKNLTSKKITSETAIADRKGFNLFYNGSNAGDKQPTLVSYTPDSGELVFMTNHFSLYYVTSTSAVAVNETTGVAYTSLESAVKAVTNSGYITLLKDATGVKDAKDPAVITIKDGEKEITIDFNDKKYFVKNKYAFKFGKGNKVTLKNGTVKSIYESNAPGVLVESYCDLTLDNIYLDCSDVAYSADGVLFCGYGKTIITGNTMISNRVEERDSKGNPTKYVCKYNCMALSIRNSFADSYKEGVSVTFDENFTGKVTGYINFELDKTNEYDGTEYKHSLIIEGTGDFSTARFCFSRVGEKSLFRMDGTPTLYVAEDATKYDKFPVDTGNNGVTTLDFDKVVVHNKTTDAVYEELGRAINDSSNGQVLVLRKNFDMESSIANPFNTKSVTIDLNGKTLGVKDSISPKIITLSSGCLTIEDGVGNGLLNKPIDSFFEFGGGKLVINGGTFVSDPTAYVVSSTHDVTPDSNEKPSTWTVSAK